MAIQFSVAVRNGRLDAIETTIGTSAVLRVFDGTKPADCATADAGTVVSTLSLPSDWMAAAASGSKAKSGTWSDLLADNTGTAQYFRVYDSGGTTCGIQGSVSATGGGGDLQFNTTSFVSGGSVTITAFTLTDGNA